MYRTIAADRYTVTKRSEFERNENMVTRRRSRSRPQARKSFCFLKLNKSRRTTNGFVCLKTQQERRAIVVLKGPGQVTGNVTFVQSNRGGPVTVTGVLSGLTEGPHGFHVHEKGDLSNGCMSTGSHFNPQAVSTPQKSVKCLSIFGGVGTSQSVLDTIES